MDFISEGADYYEREKAGCQEQMEKCCSSVSYVTGGSTWAECEGFTQRTFKTGLYHPMSSEAWNQGSWWNEGGKESTSYIAMEFWAPLENQYLVVGVCIEYVNETSNTKKWFVFKDTRIDDCRFYTKQNEFIC